MLAEGSITILQAAHFLDIEVEFVNSLGELIAIEVNEETTSRRFELLEAERI